MAAYAADLKEAGNSLLKGILISQECETLASLYDCEEHFRSCIIMSRHGFGRGEYKYFRYSLPEILQELRNYFYERLVPIANQWNQAIGMETRYRLKC